MIGDYHDYLLDEAILLLYSVKNILDILPEVPKKKGFTRLILAKFRPIIKYILEQKHNQIRSETLSKYLNMTSFAFTTIPPEGGYTSKQQEGILRQLGDHPHHDLIARIRSTRSGGGRVSNQELQKLLNQQVFSEFQTIAKNLGLLDA